MLQTIDDKRECLCEFDVLSPFQYYDICFRKMGDYISIYIQVLCSAERAVMSIPIDSKQTRTTFASSLFPKKILLKHLYVLQPKTGV